MRGVNLATSCELDFLRVQSPHIADREYGASEFARALPSRSIKNAAMQLAMASPRRTACYVFSESLTSLRIAQLHLLHQCSFEE